jgi:hypothetical protein
MPRLPLTISDLPSRCQSGSQRRFERSPGRVALASAAAHAAGLRPRRGGVHDLMRGQTPTLVLLFGADIKLARSLSLAVSLPTMLVDFTRYNQDQSFSVLGHNRA